MEQEQARRPSLPGAVNTVLWSFLGIRRRSAHESETAPLSPAHIVVAGVIGAAMFVVVLVTLVRFIVTGAG